MSGPVAVTGRDTLRGQSYPAAPRIRTDATGQLSRQVLRTAFRVNKPEIRVRRPAGLESTFQKAKTLTNGVISVPRRSRGAAQKPIPVAGIHLSVVDWPVRLGESDEKEMGANKAVAFGVMPFGIRRAPGLTFEVDARKSFFAIRATRRAPASNPQTVSTKLPGLRPRRTIQKMVRRIRMIVSGLVVAGIFATGVTIGNIRAVSRLA